MFFLLNTATVTGKADAVESDETKSNGKTHKQSVFESELHEMPPFGKLYILLFYYRHNRKNLEYAERSSNVVNQL
jgi:hypothetical protein